MTVSWKSGQDFRTQIYPVHKDIHAWILFRILNCLLEEARKVLPSTVPYADALTNVSRVALLPAAMANADNDLLFEATEDTLHQPYQHL